MTLCRRAGIGELYLATVQSFGAMDDPRNFGFDAAVEFPPHEMAIVADPPADLLNPDFDGMFYHYIKTSENFMKRPMPPYKLFRTAMPSWDNTARRQDSPTVFPNANPESYERWLRNLVEKTRQFHTGDEKLVFVNAWNEWAEGNHLEPDRRFGHEFLKATRNALGNLAYTQPLRADEFGGDDSDYCAISTHDTVGEIEERI